jgi:hypothetical protein
MLLDRQASGSSAFPRCFALPTRCSHCGDWLVAPDASEFIEGGEIRHHWACDTCGGESVTLVAISIQSPAKLL